MDVIASRKNPLVAQMRRIAAGDDTERMLLEGLHLVEEARAAQVPIQTLAVSARALAAADGAARRLAASLAGVGARVVQCPDAVIDAMSPATAPSGVIASATRPRASIERILPPHVARPFILVAVDVQDPGNLGAIARVGEAAGAAALIAAGESADPFGWKALRGAMGSAFRLPIVRARETGAALDRLDAAGVQVAAAVLGESEPYDRVDWTPAIAVLLGNEGAGLPPALAARARTRVSIPMAAPVESLNVATAAALFAFEARRQRAGARTSDLRGDGLQPLRP